MAWDIELPMVRRVALSVKELSMRQKMLLCVNKGKERLLLAEKVTGIATTRYLEEMVRNRILTGAPWQEVSRTEHQGNEASFKQMQQQGQAQPLRDYFFPEPSLMAEKEHTYQSECKNKHLPYGPSASRNIGATVSSHC